MRIPAGKTVDASGVRQLGEPLARTGGGRGAADVARDRVASAATVGPGRVERARGGAPEDERIASRNEGSRG